MDAKKRLTIYLDPRVIDVLKLDAILTHSTMSSRMRELIEAHAEKLKLGQPRSLFEQPEPQEFAQ